MSLRKILIDTDVCAGLPGAEIDDAAALIALVRDPQIAVAHVTTVFGNATIQTVTQAAVDLLKRLGSDVSVTAGAEAPRRSQPFSPPWEPEAKLCVQQPNVDAAKEIARQAKLSPGLSIVALGPLTNLALALEADPSIVDHIDHVFVMGGNRNPSGEFNFDADPAATTQVLNAGWTITLFGLDITNQQTFSPSWFSGLRSDPAVDVLKEAAPAWIAEVEKNGWHSGGCALHDAVPAVYVSQPSIASTGPMPDSQLVALGITTGGQNLRIAETLDGSAFQTYLEVLLQAENSGHLED